MADKFRNTFPIPVNFVDGELPSAAKMNGLAKQARSSSQLLEYGVGDLWNQSGDPLLQKTSIIKNALMIPSLARFIGAIKYLSPRVPKLPNIEEYKWKPHPSSDVGQREAIITFPPASGSTYSWSGTGAPTTLVTSASDVNATGKWYIYPETGRVIFYDAIVSDWELTYKPQVDGDFNDENLTFNIIPDLDTEVSYSFGGLKIQYVNGTDNTLGYYIYLPPRGPLSSVRSHEFSPQDNVKVPAHSGNFQSNTPLSSNPKRFWQADSIDAETSDTTTAEHYRYVLPTIITDEWSSGVSLPQGSIYLWDSNNTGTILDGVLFSAESAPVPRKYLIIASGAALDAYLSGPGASAYPVANLQSSSHDASMYPSNGLRLICCGSPIGNVLSSLIKQFMDHNHSKTASFPVRPPRHTQLLDTFDRSGGGGTPQLDSSGLAFDDHPQYLHRSGMNSSRDKYKGGMLGDLFLTSTDSSNNYDNLLGPSRRLRFGSNNDFSMYFSGTYMSMNFETNTILGLEILRTTTNARLDISPSTSDTSSTITAYGVSGNLNLRSNNGNVNIDVDTAGQNIFIGFTKPVNNVTLGSSNASFTAIDSAFQTSLSSEGPVFINAGTNTPAAQQSGDGVNIRSSNRIDIAAGATAPTITGHVGDDIFLRSADDIEIYAYDDLILRANNSTLGQILIKDTDIRIDDSTKTYRILPVTKDIVTGLTAPGGDFGWSLGGSGWSASDTFVDLIFYVTDWPQGANINSIDVTYSANGSSLLYCEINRVAIGGGISGTWKSRFSLNGTGAGTGTQTILPDGPSNVINDWDHGFNIMEIIFDTGNIGGSVRKVFPYIKMNVTFDTVSKWHIV